MARIPKPFWWRRGWYTDLGGKRQLLAEGKQNYAAAKKELTQLQAALATKEALAKGKSIPNIRIKALIDLFAEMRRQEGAVPGTLANYRACFKRFVLFIGGNPEATSITKLDAAMWQKNMMRQKVANNTFNSQLRILKTLYSWASKKDIIPAYNPFSPIKNLPSTNRQRLMTTEEFEKICEHTPCIHMLDFFTAMRFTSARPGELVKAQWPMVDFAAQLLILHEHKTAKTATEKKPRIIFLPDNIIAILKRRKIDYPKCPYLFCEQKREQWTVDRIGWCFRKVLKLAGITKNQKGEKLVLYSMRHTILTQAARAGVTGPQLQVLGGWTGLDMAKRYVHFSETDAVTIGRKAAEAIRNQKE